MIPIGMAVSFKAILREDGFAAFSNHVWYLGIVAL